MVELLLWIAALWALFFATCFVSRATLGRRWKGLGALGVIPAVLIAIVLVFFAPPIGGYNHFAASYWMSRAAAEPDSAAKEAIVRRIALDSPNYGWHAASQAITTVENATQRCRLRTLLAGLPEVRNRGQLGSEARDECNAALLKSGS